MKVDEFNVADGWRRAYARQSLSDFQVYDLLCLTPAIDECQRLHYLQMALEKAAKAHFWETSGAASLDSKINRSHRVAEKFLPNIMREYWRRVSPGSIMPGALNKFIKNLCREVDLLAPAVLDGEDRRDNCEYPWEIFDDKGIVVAVQSPIDHAFHPSSLLRDPRAGTFLKAVRVLMAEVAGMEPSRN